MGARLRAVARCGDQAAVGGPVIGTDGVDPS